MFALLIHIYYEGSWELMLRDKILRLSHYSPLLMINLCHDSIYKDKIIQSIKNDFPHAYIITTPNKGKDIGGKLALLDLYIKTKQRADYIVLLHDKISPHAVTGDAWRIKLFDIIDPLKVKEILKQFSTKNQVGIIGAKEFLKSEFDEKKAELETTNKFKLAELLKKYNIHVNNYTFIAGTMFWVRSSIFLKFFSNHNPLDCRIMLEEGDFTDQFEGTYTHSWERLFCFLAIADKFYIKGI